MELGYSHEVTVMSSDDPVHVSMPGIHQIASLQKRWILGTHQGFIAQGHPQSYLEEFTFCFNLCTSRSRELVFLKLLEQAVITSPTTEFNVIGSYDWGLETDTD